ncbi:MAG: hypothetical protein MK101_03985 [Phycisphaerales bacterium]|nr:hypothetical protein [Phycisphaerales bacterium]
MVHLILSLALVAGLCEEEDLFNDGSIGSNWMQVSDPTGAVTFSEHTAPDAGLHVNFATNAASEDPDVAGIMSDGWVVDMNQSGTIQLQFLDAIWPAGIGYTISIGVGLFDGMSPEGDPNVVIEVQGGVREGIEYFQAAGSSGEGAAATAADLEQFNGNLYIWWQHDVGIWYGFSPTWVVDGGPWDDVFSPDNSMSLMLALYGSSSSCTAPLIDQFGFESMCYRTGTAGMPELCDADVMPTYDIDILDVTAVLDVWGQTCGDCRADVDKDGHVTMLDLIEVLAAWGDCQINPA